MFYEESLSSLDFGFIERNIYCFLEEIRKEIRNFYR